MAYVAGVTVCSMSMVRSMNGVIQIIDVCVFLCARHGELRYLSQAGVVPRRFGNHVDARRVGLRTGNVMAKQEAMSLQARRARPVVVTGIALATAGILVAVPAIAPPLTARDVQVAEDVQSALSTAQVNLALSAEAISAALDAFPDGGPVNALLAGIGAEVGDPVLSAVIDAFPDGGPLDAVLAGIGAAVGDPVLSAVIGAFPDGGPLNAVLAGISVAVGDPVLTAAIEAFPDGGPIDAVLAAISEAVGDPVLTAAIEAFPDGGPLNAVLAGIGAAVGDPVLSAVIDAFPDGGPLDAVLAGIGERSDPVLSAVIDAFPDGGPLGAVLAGIGERSGTRCCQPLSGRSRIMGL